MEVKFADKRLERLLFEAGYRAKLPQEVVTAYRKRMQFLRHASDERELRAMKSFHFEELRGRRKGQHSVRLNKKYRLVFRMEEESGRKVVIVLSIEDYH